jgi:predicted ATPase/DNA-binding winged helix-turn-helix (wHTH) protein
LRRINILRGALDHAPGGREVVSLPQPTSTDQMIEFGPFRLLPDRRLLLKGDAPIRIGDRALRILTALVEHAGQEVSKQDLLTRAWPNMRVEESNVRAHVAALRKALGDGEAGSRYVINIPGRGYCFVAPIATGQFSGHAGRQTAWDGSPTNLPTPLGRIVGRDDTIDALVVQVRTRRLVTIVGPGGIGKTTVAVAAAGKLEGAFREGARFLDIAPLAEPKLLPNALAAILGLPLRTGNPLTELLAFFETKKMLLVFDSCEHMIDATADLAREILAGAPGINILATSREPLRCEGEHLLRLLPLSVPPIGYHLTATDALKYSAVELFVERAMAAADAFEFDNGVTPLVVDICRRLDGIVLAIELAAGHVDVLGLSGLADHLNDRFQLMMKGRRTALARHQTLAATLDWSYELLSESERVVLRRLSIFAGPFLIESAIAVAAGSDIAPTHVVDLLVNLVMKSLVAADVSGDVAEYRLLDTTRAYAREKLDQAGEFAEFARRHATHYAVLFGSRENQPVEQRLSLDIYRRQISNLRAALGWAFSSTDDARIGVTLVAASASVLLELSHLSECSSWTERAIGLLDSVALEPRLELELHAARAVAERNTRGNTDEVYVALNRALALAESLDDGNYQLRLLEGFYMFHLRVADFEGALTFARRAEALATRMPDAVNTTAAESMLGLLNHFMGDQESARKRCEVALQRSPLTRRIDVLRFTVDHRNLMRCALARGLWLRGYPDQALRAALETVEEAEGLDHPVTHCIALAWVTPVALWRGDWSRAEHMITAVIDLAGKHWLRPFHALGLGLRGELSFRRGNVDAAIQDLRTSLEILDAARHFPMRTALRINLAEALATHGQAEESLETIETTIATINRSKEFTHLPEALRVKGLILASAALHHDARAEEQLLASLECASAQSALSWELRAATSLARLWRNHDRRDEAQALLAPVCDRFREGYATEDYRAAKALLRDLSLV